MTLAIRIICLLFPLAAACASEAPPTAHEPMAGPGSVAFRPTAASDDSYHAARDAARTSEAVRQARHETVRLTPTTIGIVRQNGTLTEEPPALVVGNVFSREIDDVAARGFLQFDLGQLPANTTRVIAARLTVQQLEVRGFPFQKLRALEAWAVDWGEQLGPAAFYGRLLGEMECDPAPFVGLLCTLSPLRTLLSVDASLGPKQAEVLAFVRDAWDSRDDRANRMQLALRFVRDGAIDGADDFVVLAGAGPDAPTLEITVEVR